MTAYLAVTLCPIAAHSSSKNTIIPAYAQSSCSRPSDDKEMYQPREIGRFGTGYA